MKTASVVVESTKTHPLYGKSFVHTKKYLVDDPFEVKVGDIVEFIKVAPISKNKHWRITNVVGKDIVAVETEIMKEVAKEAIEEVLPVEEEEDQTTAVRLPTTAKQEEIEEKKNEKVTKKPRKKEGEKLVN